MLVLCLAMIGDSSDGEDFEQLYYKYKNRVMSISRRILQNDTLAEDCTSEVFFSLAKGFSKIKSLEEHKLDYYIFIATRNTAYNLLKSEIHNTADCEYDDTIGISNQELSGYDKMFLQDCIKKLKKDEQEILYMRVSMALEYNQIAKALGTTNATARKRF